MAFAAWFVAGIACAFGVASVLTVGAVVLPAGLLLAGLLSTRTSWRHGWPGVIAGAAFVPFYIASLNRGGPGQVCESSDGGTSCFDAWSPVPFVIVGVLMLVLSAVVVVFRRRISAA